MKERAPLVVALSKGRTLKPAAELLERAGVVPADASGSLASLLTGEHRALVRHGRFRTDPVAFLLLKPDDVPTYVEYGAADLGIVGRDVLFEREADVYQPVDLGIGVCRLAVAGKVGEVVVPSGRLPRVASKFPKMAAAHFAAKGVQIDVVNLHGSIELAPLVGLSDYIVDLVETGKTLVENGLEVKEILARVSTLLVANRVSYKLRSDVVRPLVDGLRALVAPAPAS